MKKLTQHGKLIPSNKNILVKKATEVDIPLVIEFCNDCKKYGFLNNISLSHIKWDTSQFFIGIDVSLNKIITLAGYHQLLDIDNHSWRVLFRGAQLPGYSTNIVSKNPLKTIIHVGHLLHYQLLEILDIDNDAKCYISTNIESNKNAPTSYRLNSLICPLMEKQKILTLEQANIELYYTRQNLWRVNVDEYFRQRSLIYPD